MGRLDTDRQPDILVLGKKRKTAVVTDVAIASDGNIKKEHKTFDK